MPQQIINIVEQVVVVAFGIGILFAFFITIRDMVKKYKAKQKQEEHDSGLNWAILELKIPADNLKSPQAMEQVFATLHAIPSEDLMSFEIVGFSESTHFYIRLPDHLRKLLESAVFSQYPGAEITPTEDYVGRFGTDLPDENYDIAGSELVFSRDGAYPLRTYPSFDESRKDEYYIDPIATIVETMSTLKDDEMIWTQIVIHPLADKDKVKKWEKDSQGVLDELLGRKAKVKPKKLSDHIFGILKFLIVDVISGLFEHPGAKPPKKDDKPAGKSISPGENDVVRAIENKRAKFVFEATVRALYLDRRSSFVKGNMSAVVGALRQFGSPQLNSFKLDDVKMTFIEKNFGKEKKELESKKSLFQNYCKRSLSKKPLMICTEELATMYHPPHSTVGAEKLTRLEMKRGAPPTNLPEVTE